MRVGQDRTERIAWGAKSLTTLVTLYTWYPAVGNRRLGIGGSCSASQLFVWLRSLCLTDQVSVDVTIEALLRAG